MLFEHYRKNPDELPDDFQDIRAEEGVDRAVCDYIAGMTDRLCGREIQGAVPAHGLDGEVEADDRGPIADGAAR